MRLGYLGALLCCSSELALATVTVVKENGVEYVKEWDKAEPNEAAVNEQLGKILAATMGKLYKEQGKRTLRDAHPRSLGCVSAKFTINKDIDKEFRHGVFQPGKSYDAIIRTSSSATVAGPDSNPDARGFAMKLFNVPGKKISAIEPDATTQDFIMLSFPAFPATTPEEFMGFVKANAKFGSPASYFFKSLDPASWRVQAAAISFGIGSRFKEEASLLQHRQWFSAMPSMLGDKPIKFGAISCNYAKDKIARPENPGPDFLREQLRDHLAKNAACFDFVVQRYQPGYPISNGMGWWPSGSDEYAEPTAFLKVQAPELPVSPFIKIARITIPKQKVKLEPEAPENMFCDNLSMNPFHSLPEHRPLGAINRARGAIYDTNSAIRHKDNNVPVKEPKSINEFISLRKN